MTPATTTPELEPAPPQLCNLFEICDAPADRGGFCVDHREELNESSRRYRDDHARSQRRFWLAEIGQPTGFSEWTFANARPNAPIKTTLAYLDARGVPRGRAVILAGQTGTGKTVAAACLIDRLLPFLGTRMRFFLGTQLVRGLLNFDTVDEVMESAVRCRLLVIDDLQVPARADGLELINELLIRREAEGRPLVITTNLRRAQFEAGFGDRIADRIRAWGTYHELPGRSLRGGGA